MALVVARRNAFAARLAAMSTQERRALVDAARKEHRWPSWSWLESHRAEKMPDLSRPQYLALTQAVKRRPGTEVYAFIHIVHGNEGLAFIDADQRILVWFSLDEHVNMSCFFLEETLDVFIQQKGGLYWRLADTELV